MMRTRLAKVLDREDVRQMCIAHQYYTRGDCRAYENMLGLLDLPRSKYTGSNISADKLEEIAEDIKDHSDPVSEAAAPVHAVHYRRTLAEHGRA